MTPIPSCQDLPLILSWQNSHNPVPVREVRAASSRRGRTSGQEAFPWYQTGEHDQPIHFSEKIHALCADVAERCEALQHIDVSRLLITMTQARNGQAHGLLARVTPLRFREGELRHRRRGQFYQVQRYFVDDQEMLYLVTFCLPRFLNQTFDEKLITLFHELWHISPAFDGDLRRHGGRYDVHGKCKRAYDVHSASLAREYLATRPDPALSDFLRLDFAQLAHRHGRVVSHVVPRPKLIPVA